MTGFEGLRVVLEMARLGWWRKYQEILHRDPLRTKMITSAFVWGGIDLGTQRAEHESTLLDGASDDDGGGGGDENDFKVEWPRVLRQATFGVLVNATVTHYWWGWLNSALPLRTNGATLAKVAADQLFAAPIYYACFHAYTGAALGESPPEIAQRVEQRLLPTMQGVWVVWPWVHFVNFKYVSVHNMLAVAQVTNLFFNVFVSHIGNKQMDTDSGEAMVSAAVT